VKSITRLRCVSRSDLEFKEGLAPPRRRSAPTFEEHVGKQKKNDAALLVSLELDQKEYLL